MDCASRTYSSSAAQAVLHSNSQLPNRREDSDPRSIDNAEMVALRGFSTKVGPGAGQ